MIDYHSSSSSSEEYESSSSSPETPTSGITVRYSTTTPEAHPPMYAYALKAEVIQSIGYPDHIFVFQRSKETADGSWVDEFIQIASPLEVEEVPENAPDLANNMPYYRSKEVTLYFRNMEDLNLAKSNIGSDIRTLTSTYDTLNAGFDKQEIVKYE